MAIQNLKPIEEDLGFRVFAKSCDHQRSHRIICETYTASSSYLHALPALMPHQISLQLLSLNIFLHKNHALVLKEGTYVLLILVHVYLLRQQTEPK
jgi:hypothetical protein